MKANKENIRRFYPFCVKCGEISIAQQVEHICRQCEDAYQYCVKCNISEESDK